MIDLKLEPIHSYLREKHFDAHIQDETKQIYLIFKILNQEFPVFIRIFDEQAMLQMLVFMPCTMQKKALSETARLLHLLNKELDLPGFGMEEDAGTIFYRLTIPFFSGKIEPTLLDGFLNSMKELSTSLYPVIEAVASGKASFEEVLKQAETKQKS